MALQKEIENENGIVLNYHRIVSINSITNMNTNIEIASYTSYDKRKKEERYQNLQKRNWNNELNEDEKEELEKGINIYIACEYIQIPYDKNINVDNAYDYLKTTEKYKGSKDV